MAAASDIDEVQALRLQVAALQTDAVALRQRLTEAEASEARFKHALGLSATALFQHDAALRYTWINHSHFGFDPERVLGKTDWDIMEPGLAGRMEVVKRGVLDTGIGTRLDVWTCPDDPDAKVLDLILEPLRDPDGTVVGLSGASVDITAMKRAEIALRGQGELLREVQTVAHLGYYVYELASDHWESSEILDRIFGIGPDYKRDVAHWLAIVAPEMRAEMDDYLGSIMASDQNFDREYIIRRIDDGERRWVAGLGNIVRDAAGQPIRMLGTIQDITARKNTERDLAQQARKLSQSNAELERFAYVASHDLRQPLRMVSSYLSVIERRLGADLDEELKEYFHFAVDGAKRMDRLILDLLEYSRIGRAEASVPVPLAEAIAEAKVNLTVAIEEAEAEVVVTADLPTVAGDANELTRLFQNLLDNAVKYRTAGRRPHVGIACDRQENQWLVSVADNGIGIAPEGRERAFGIFQRLVPPGSYEGTGIGLALCRKIVEHHGGRIWIESTPGEGSTFYFTLPLAADPPGTS